MIYDDVHLQVTRQLAKGRTEMEEREVLSLVNEYFEFLSTKKDIGRKFLEKFAKWQEDETVHEPLRGRER